MPSKKKSKIYRCRTCGKVYVYIGWLKRHIKAKKHSPVWDVFIPSATIEQRLRIIEQEMDLIKKSPFQYAGFPKVDNSHKPKKEDEPNIKIVLIRELKELINAKQGNIQEILTPAPIGIYI